jgi:dihydrofolate reductase
MAGGTTFIFVTDGIEAAFQQAKQAAGDRDVLLAGGASVVRQHLAAGLVDEVAFPRLIWRGCGPGVGNEAAAAAC